jgi:hypothetical protein
MTVDLPEPFGPRKAEDRPFPDRKGNVIDRSEWAEAFRQPLTLNHCLAHFVS